MDILSFRLSGEGLKPLSGLCCFLCTWGKINLPSVFILESTVFGRKKKGDLKNDPQSRVKWYLLMSLLNNSAYFLFCLRTRSESQSHWLGRRQQWKPSRDSNLFFPKLKLDYIILFKLFVLFILYKFTLGLLQQKKKKSIKLPIDIWKKYRL